MRSGGWIINCTGFAGRRWYSVGGVAAGSWSVSPRGRLPDFCSGSHRQLAYKQRKWQRPHAVAALADDIDAAKVRGVIREEIVAALRQTGLVPQAMPPPKPNPRRLKLVEKKDE
jgi:hypothetical protein